MKSLGGNYVTLIAIGQFSKMTRLSVKALRHYDEKGLLSPVKVDPSSSYRYYSRSQLRHAEMIRILRSVDMPLDRIKAVVSAKDRTLVSRELLAHRERLASVIAVQQRMLSYLESLIDREEILVSYEVELNDVAPIHIAAVRTSTTLSRVGADIQAGFATLVSGLASAGVSPIGAPLLVHHDLLEAEATGEIEVCVPIDESFQGTEKVSSRTLEGGLVASTIHKGPYEAIGPAYHALNSWISANAHEIAGPPREIYLNDPQTVPQDELLTRLSYPVACKEKRD